ncbi:DEKNAAC100204 [Brettanomyces naardenensis]|uniref:DEKNAAC100204 n=1 Tax=Brettanomyces naardenensis TaxID=13370 RepID=A0A448YG98_BRENA|nr:DEKNAAC100204 [Brettanomyces naardenensis]
MTDSLTSNDAQSESTTTTEPTTIATEDKLAQKFRSVTLQDSKDGFSIENLRSTRLLQLFNPSNKLRYHDLLETDFLSEFQKTDIFPSKFTVKLISWNLCQVAPTTELAKMVKMSSPNGDYAELYILTFQETVSLRSFSHNGSVIDQWCGTVLRTLPAGYKVVHKSGLLGLTTIVLASNPLSAQISDVRVETVGLGYLSWYNKGCISVRFSLGKVGDSKLSGLPIQILNMHLVHGEEDSSANARAKNLQKIGNTFSLVNESAHLTPDSGIEAKDTIERTLDLSDIELQKISNESVSISGISEPPVGDGIVLLSGDLNFRISELGRDSILSYTNSKSFAELTRYDELSNMIGQKSVFQGFQEGVINFPPTFKLKGRSGEYDIKRKPAYTDRILYCGPQLTIKQLEYGSYPVYGSDHLPVCAEFEISTAFFHPQSLLDHRLQFKDYYQHVISSMRLLEIEPETIEIDCCSGFEQRVEFMFKNLCDESLTYKIAERNKGFFRQATFRIDKERSTIDRKSEKPVVFTATPAKIGKITASYSVTLSGFDALKTISITLNVKSVVGVDIDKLEEQQYQNIVDSFTFILSSKSTLGLTSHLLDIESFDSLSKLEQNILKQVTLDRVNFGKLAGANEIGNKASVAVLDAMYMWMKFLPDINIGTPRGRVLFSKLIDLIKFLGMDNEKAYEYFGFLFNDEYEILDYLESSVH